MRNIASKHALFSGSYRQPYRQMAEAIAEYLGTCLMEAHNG